MVAAGDFDPESERDIYFASEHCKADPGPPIVPVDFIPELWGDMSRNHAQGQTHTFPASYSGR